MSEDFERYTLNDRSLALAQFWIWVNDSYSILSAPDLEEWECIGDYIQHSDKVLTAIKLTHPHLVPDNLAQKIEEQS